MEPVKISKTLTKRLHLYLEYLQGLPGEDCNISATAIAGALGLGEVQVRKDLAKISGEGRCRTGRSRNQLLLDIRRCLERTGEVNSIIVGGGNLEPELMKHDGIDVSLINVMARFELEPTGTRVENGRPVYSINRLETFCKHYDVRIGIIAVPMEKAQSVCDGMVACGIQAIWNLSAEPLKVPQGICLRSRTAG